jgi:hypothetical protein
MKRPGRPRLDPETKSVQWSVRLTTKQFDQTQRCADEARMTMAAWVRRMLDGGVLHHKNRH